MTVRIVMTGRPFRRSAINRSVIGMRRNSSSVVASPRLRPTGPARLVSDTRGSSADGLVVVGLLDRRRGYRRIPVRRRDGDLAIPVRDEGKVTGKVSRWWEDDPGYHYQIAASQEDLASRTSSPAVSRICRENALHWEAAGDEIVVRRLEGGR